MTKVYSITFVQPNGILKKVDAPDGLSVLEIAHNNSIELEGVCEGAMACSTCHVVIDLKWFKYLEPATDEEEDMLDFAFGLTQTSRLGCQLKVSKKLDGLVVHIPTEHHNFLN